MKNIRVERIYTIKVLNKTGEIYTIQGPHSNRDRTLASTISLPAESLRQWAKSKGSMVPGNLPANVHLSGQDYTKWLQYLSHLVPYVWSRDIPGHAFDRQGQSL